MSSLGKSQIFNAQTLHIMFACCLSPVSFYLDYKYIVKKNKSIKYSIFFIKTHKLSTCMPRHFLETQLAHDLPQ